MPGVVPARGLPALQRHLGRRSAAARSTTWPRRSTGGRSQVPGVAGCLSRSPHRPRPSQRPGGRPQDTFFKGTGRCSDSKLPSRLPSWLVPKERC
ncbi:hypothetical protein NDU88_005925 [Pleurodeles waltl]|uniref:Uncharacterized protein n=1 Tax=Pleurodeles waltl TaxID=8319 RepID=A0AAV7LQG2_PLEWA|nr:hypothetical protein NDU88_005925 [Pleurodeles waltl]